MQSLSLTTNQADHTGKMEFQEFKVFWEKMKKWIVCVDLRAKTKISTWWRENIDLLPQ